MVQGALLLADRTTRSLVDVARELGGYGPIEARASIQYVRKIARAGRALASGVEEKA
jgi:hypothetical protein